MSSILRKSTTTTTTTMSRETTAWDQLEKGGLTDAERIAKNLDVGSGRSRHLPKY